MISAIQGQAMSLRELVRLMEEDGHLAENLPVYLKRLQEVERALRRIRGTFDVATT